MSASRDDLTLELTDRLADLNAAEFDYLTIGLLHATGCDLVTHKGSLWLHHLDTGAMLRRPDGDTVGKCWRAALLLESAPMPLLERAHIPNPQSALGIVKQ